MPASLPLANATVTIQGPDPTGLLGYPIAVVPATGGGGFPVSVADGSDVAEGSTTDAAIQGDTAGTVNAHLRGLTKATGTNGDAAVVTNATGTILGFLRGIVTLLAATLTVQGTVTGAPVRGSLTNRSGTITLGGTAQTLAAANTSRSYLLVQNISAENLWINFTTAAVADQPSFKIVPGDTFFMESSFLSTELISIIGATTGSKFVSKEG